MKRTFAFAAIISSILAAIACSSSSNSGSGNGTCTGSPTTNSNPACGTCIQNNCSGEISSFQSACSDFVTCSCADGGASCLSKLQESGCQSAATSVGSCEQTKCSSECAVSMVDSGGGGQDSAVMMSAACTSLASCCSQLPANEQSSCTSVANLNNDQACTSAAAAFMDAGQCQ